MEIVGKDQRHIRVLKLLCASSFKNSDAINQLNNLKFHTTDVLVVKD